MRFCDLCEKEVINVCDCRVLGSVADMEFDECKGCICALIVPECRSFWGIFSPPKELVIPWNKVIKIGPDIVLVDIGRQERCGKEKHG